MMAPIHPLPVRPMPFAPLLLAACWLLCAACSLRARTPAPGPEQAPLASASAATASDPPPLPREFRAAWVATVNNIDFPSRPGLPAAALRAELDAIVARAVELRLNALVFQVRPAADAFYRSRLEPWSEWLTGAQGRPPDQDFDPLAHLIERCHAQGLLLHAWFNPYRASHPTGRSPAAAAHVSRQAPQLCVRYGSYTWMDPGEPLARKWSLAVIQDVVRRYDVDGVHFDDYFYPYVEQKQVFPDDGSYQRYRQGGGTLGRSDWRRHNIDSFVQQVREVVHADEPWVAIGISPFGIARPGVPKGIQAGVDAYEQLAADAPKWLREGTVDYLAPQLYWPIDQAPQSFPVLLQWWHAQNPKQRGLWPGINPGRVLAGGKNHRPDELVEQIALIRAADRTPGHIHFSFKALRGDDARVGGALRNRVYRDVALAPAMPWLDATEPPCPTATLAGRELRWTADASVRFVAVQVRDGKGWRTAGLVGATQGRFRIDDPATAVAVSAVSRTGVASRPVTLAVK